MSEKKHPKLDRGPRLIRALFPSVCAETGRAIEAGEECIYYPERKEVYCLESRQAEDWQYL